MNNQIRVSSVRVVDNDGNQLGILPTYEALQKARQAGLDLVEVAPTAQPPVCRIVDYGKYKFELAKKEKEARKSQGNQKVKEVKFHTSLDDHDYQFKVRHIREFLGEGHRVKVSLMFRGREQAHTELGHQLMRRVMKDVEDVARMDRAPEQMGRFINMMISPQPGGRKPAPAAKPAGPGAGPTPVPTPRP